MFSTERKNLTCREKLSNCQRHSPHVVKSDFSLRYYESGTHDWKSLCVLVGWSGHNAEAKQEVDGDFRNGLNIWFLQFPMDISLLPVRSYDHRDDLHIDNKIFFFYIAMKITTFKCS